MILAVIDTHALIWFVMDDPRFSPVAAILFKEAEVEADQIAVSSISLVEVVYLIEKRRIDPATLLRILALLESGSFLLEAPLDRQVVAVMSSIPRDEVPDMPDRIIAATALHFEVPLISRDRKIVASRVPTIW